MEIDLKKKNRYKREEEEEEKDKIAKAAAAAAKDRDDEDDNDDEEEEIDADFSLLQIDNARIIEEMMSIKKRYEIVVKNIYTMICIVVMFIALCNLCKYKLLFSVIFMIAFTALHLKNYGLSLIYQTLNIPQDKKQQ